MDGYVTIRTQIDTKEFDAQMNYIERRMLDIEEKIKQADMGYEVGDTEKLEAEYERLGNQLINLKERQEKYNQSLQKASAIDLKGVEKQLNKIGNSVEKVTKKVGHWALAVFGIRSAYLFVRQAMSTLSEYDEQMAVNVQWIRYLLANALKPVIETIINLAYKLLVYISYIAKAWFGVNIFASASLKAFQKQQKAMGGTAKKAKELQKTIAGFDEMNVLQDNKNTSGAGTSGITTPNFPSMDDVEIPGWIKWIAENKDLILSVLTGIASGLVAIKLGASGLMGLGIGIAVAGIIMLIQDIIKFIKDPTWENFIDILADIAIAIGGIMLATGNWWGLLVAVVGLLVKLVIDNWGTIQSVLGTIGNWIYNYVIKPVANFFVGLWNTLKTGATNAWNGIKSVFSTVASFFKNTFTNAWTAVKNVFSTGGKIFTGIKDGILNAFKKIVNTLIDGINKVIKIPFDGINDALKSIKNINIMGAKPFKGLISTISVPKIPHLAKGGIINMPGSGVAVGGESGREGVIPLTDSQQMQLLGEAIGKYITINANITNTMNGRVISRELQKINTENDFAYNR